MRRMTAACHSIVPKLLLIDDDSPIHALVRTHIDPQRVDLIGASDGLAGLEIAIRKHPDVILLDLDMPGMNGFDVCRKLKTDRRTRWIPVIFLTAAADTASKMRGLECGALDYVVKPYDPAELRARLGTAFQMKLKMDQSERDAMVDELTGLFGRRYFDARLEADLAIARRRGRPLGCLVADIDHLGAINSVYGTEIGDHLFRQVGYAIARCCRKEDTLCRFGSDEFAILVSGASGETMRGLAQRIRQAVGQAAAALPNQVVRISVSIGFAVARFSVGTSVVTEAISALQRAQGCGGDCVRDGKELLELRLVG
jgi:diguanylate cyclase (GGDEF)-like protein